MGLSGVSASGAVSYQFDFTPGGSSAFQATTFTVTVPQYIQPGLQSVTPFALTDGTDTFTMTQLYAGTSGALNAFCLIFGTSAATIGSCSGGSNTPGEAALFLSYGYGPTLPTAPGVFLSSNAIMFYTGSVGFLRTASNSATLTVQEIATPEPSAAAVTAVGVLCVVLRRRR